MASTELQLVIDMLRALPMLADADFAQLRANLELMSTARALRDDVRLETVDAGGVPAEWTTVPHSAAGKVILYLHGGGYCIGSVRSHRHMVGEIARHSGARALSVDYRLAPECPFPAAVEDAVAAYRWLVTQGIAPDRIGIAGDSAGGGLTMATLVALRAAGDPLPAAAVGISPWLDLTQSGASITTKAELDPLIQKIHLDKFAAAYVGEGDPKCATASPLFADLTGLPPLLLQVGTAETLLDDSVRFADRARRAGVEVSVDVYDDMIHVWHAFEGMLPEATDAIERIGQFFQRRLAH